MRKHLFCAMLIIVAVGVAQAPGVDKNPMRSSMDRSMETDSRILNHKILELEEKLANTERMLRNVMEKLDKAEGISSRLTERELQKPVMQRITSVMWNGKTVPMKYLGKAELNENQLGMVDGHLNGLAFHPDGRIAISEGRGISDDMKIAYWNPSGRIETVVPIRHTSESDLTRLDSREKKGYFHHFSGPLTFDQNGTCYFSLGPQMQNGIYKVVSSSPVVIDKLKKIQDSLYLQVPHFDKKHIYSSSGNEIHRIPIRESEMSMMSKPWFKLTTGKGVLMNEALAISPNRLMVNCVVLKDTNLKDLNFENRTLIFDKDRQGFWSLPVKDYGAYAISWDGKRVIGFDQSDRMVKEIEFTNIPRTVQVAETD